MSELDQTIEELEAEVLAELEEAAHDAPTKGSAGAEPMKKVKKNAEDGAVVILIIIQWLMDINGELLEGQVVLYQL